MARHRVPTIPVRTLVEQRLERLAFRAPGATCSPASDPPASGVHTLPVASWLKVCGLAFPAKSVYNEAMG